MKGLRHLRYLCAMYVPLLIWMGQSWAMPDGIGVQDANELKNRFRIDHKVSGLTLFVQREYGSAPVVIVLPDGRKWYANHHPEHVSWAQGKAGDMIMIEQPMAGPWQLLGQINSGSTITKASSLSIRVDTIPQPVFQGERLKLTASLQNDSDRIRLPGLDYLIKWQARFISVRHSQDENFAVGSVNVGQYLDNGEAFDESPDDGVFTSQLDFNQAWGEYIFEVKMYNDIVERERRIPFILSKRPINVALMSDASSDEAIRSLMLDVDDIVLSLAETQVVLELIGPTGMRQTIDVNHITDKFTEITLPKITHLGGYRLNVSAVSTVKERSTAKDARAAREIYLMLPEIFFNLIQLPPRLTPKELVVIKFDQAVAAEKTAKQHVLVWMISGNAFLLLAGLLSFMGWRRRQQQAVSRRSAKHALKQSQADVSMVLDEIDLTLPGGKY
ncbi:TIGR03503 family protein [Shewanella surugensis]|uniref:TIGR03503 family protein n=1 Tax=Shewanella surugensis TaxID=212020 RepID=A0ABT0LBT8_9GAMM|nr:TIGR03503 family protein [Shewanella surugensis]MCL1125141.1 TIGR03503 family protein [Shewanella surugensis]